MCLLQIHSIGNESRVLIYPLPFTNSIEIFHSNSNNMHYFPHYLSPRLYNSLSYASESSLLFDILVKAIILLNLRTNFACFQKFSHGYIDFFVRLYLFTKNAIIVIRVKTIKCVYCTFDIIKLTHKGEKFQYTLCTIQAEIGLEQVAPKDNTLAVASADFQKFPPRKYYCTD